MSMNRPGRDRTAPLGPGRPQAMTAAADREVVRAWVLACEDLGGLARFFGGALSTLGEALGQSPEGGRPTGFLRRLWADFVRFHALWPPAGSARRDATLAACERPSLWG